MPFDVRHVAARLSACPEVTGLHAGPLGTIVTPTDAGPVIGVRMDRAMIVLGIVVDQGADDADVAAGVRDRLSAVVAGLPISMSFRKIPA